MKKYHLKEKDLLNYRQYMVQEERALSTIQKYDQGLHAFMYWLNERPVSKEMVVAWKAALIEQGKAPGTINSMLSALNGFFSFMGYDHFRVKFLRVQKRVFCSAARELTRVEYERLLSVAESQGKHRLALLMETICATGIRVSEVQYITTAAAQKGTAEIMLKGKIRTILLPGKLCRKLLKYAKKQGITGGAIFRTASGRSMSRRQIWGEMKDLCRMAKVDRSKVFPHNLRHLFARRFYHVSQDIVKLADVLGHSSIETTRIYLVSTGAEHTRCLERLGLVRDAAG